MTDPNKLLVKPEEEKPTWSKPKEGDDSNKLSPDRVGEIPKRVNKLDTERGDLRERAMRAIEGEKNEKKRIKREIDALSLKIDEFKANYKAVGEKALNKNPELVKMFILEFSYFKVLSTLLRYQSDNVDEGSSLSQSAFNIKRDLIAFGKTEGLSSKVFFYRVISQKTSLPSGMDSLKELQKKAEVLYRQEKSDLEA